MDVMPNQRTGKSSSREHPRAAGPLRSSVRSTHRSRSVPERKRPGEAESRSHFNQHANRLTTDAFGISLCGAAPVFFTFPDYYCNGKRIALCGTHVLLSFFICTIVHQSAMPNTPSLSTWQCKSSRLGGNGGATPY
jgi:hypothetical protein